MRIITVAALAGSLAGFHAGAATLYTDLAAFNAASGGTTAVPLPDIGFFGTGPLDVGPLTFTSLSGSMTFGGGFDSTLIPGTDAAISGVEAFRVDIGAGATAFSFYIHEPTKTGSATVDGCNTTECVDSTFDIEVYSGGSLINSFAVEPVDDAADFFGIFDVSGFDSVVIRERNTSVFSNDNEYFGAFGVTVIPLPPALPALAAGLGLLGLLGRRKSST